MTNIEEFLNSTYVGIVPYVMAGFGLLFIYKLVHDKLTDYDDDAVIAGGNTAAALNRVGGYVGVLFAMAGSLINSRNEYFTDVGMFALDGVVALIVFTLASFVLDWAILQDVPNGEEIEKRNVAVGLTEGSAYVALGIIMMASFSGSGAGLVEGLLSAVVFSFFGLATLVFAYRAYCWVIEYKYELCPDKLIGRGKMSAAVDSASVLLGVSFVLFFSISGNFTGWSDDISSYSRAAVVSVLVVIVARFMASWLLPGNTRKVNNSIIGGNVAMSIVTGGVTLGFASVVGFVIGI